MRQRPRMLFRFIFLLAALAAVFSAQAQDYEIRLSFPDKVGDKSRVSVTGRDRQEMSVWSEGKKLREQVKELSVTFEAVAIVLEVSPKGRAKRLSLQVEKLATKEGGIEKELLARGAVVTAALAEKKTVFEMNGRRVEPAVAQALENAVTIGSHDYTDDELFGTRERKRVGESWGANRAAMMETLQDPRMSVKDLKGQVTLKEVLKDAKGQRLLVTFDVSGQALPAAGSPMPPGTLSVKGTAEFPTAPARSRVMETMEMTYTARDKLRPNANGLEAEMRADMKKSRRVQLTPVP